MKAIQYIFTAFFLMLFGVAGTAAQTGDYYTTYFELLPQSKIALEGTTNINQFDCFAESLVDGVSVTMKPEKIIASSTSDEQCTLFDLQNAKVTIEVAQLECGQEAINKDMRKTLKASEHPKIVIILKQIHVGYDEAHMANNVMAQVEMVIAGSNKPVQLNLNGTKNEDDGFFRVSGRHTLHLTDFGIDPPKALFGLIKVQDQIDIMFDIAFKQLGKSIDLEKLANTASGAN